MPQPFNSRRFFTDPFFTKPAAGDNGYVTITKANLSSLTVPCVYRHGLDPERDSTLIAMGGHWAEIAILVRDYEATFGADVEPAIDDLYETDGEEFRGKAHSKDGDVFTVKALGSQRKAAK